MSALCENQAKNNRQKNSVRTIGDEMEFVWKRLFKPRESTASLFREKGFNDLYGLLITFLGLLAFGLFPRLVDTQRRVESNVSTVVLFEVIVPVAILSFLIYLLFSGILFLCARILRRTPSYRDCRYIAGSSFWLPMAALAPIAIVAILLTGGDHVRADLIPYLLPLVFAIVFILPIWGLAVQILTVSKALQASILRAAGIVLLSAAAFLALSLGPLFLVFNLFG